MATNWSICGVCDSLQITKDSVIWCSECDEGLCRECKNHHAVCRATRSHETVSIAEYNKLPTEVLKIAQTCKLHNDKYELFCKKHDCPCCKKCLRSHSDCKGLTDINEFITNVKTSNALYEIENNLLEVVENIKRLSINRKENVKSLENKRREINAEIKQVKNEINHHLDTLHDDLIQELLRVEQEEKSEIETCLATLKKKEREIIEVQENLASIKQHASELQTFLAMKDIEKDIAVAEKFIQSIITRNCTNQVNISCQFNKSLLQITTSVQNFGGIYVSSDPCNFPLQKRKDRQAQIISPRNIDNLTLTLKERVNSMMENVHGCSLLPNGRMIFSSIAGPLQFSDRLEYFKIDTIGETFDVVFIGDDSIAVTSGSSNQINIIDLKQRKLKKSIKVDSYNGGVVYKNGHLIYCAGEKGIQMISLNDETITSVSNTKLPDGAYIATFGDKLFYTNENHHSVTCCDYHGNMIWTFSDEGVLNRPLGITVDNDGNVYVVSNRSFQLVVISPEGKHYRVLLGFEDGLIYPWSLHYDTSTNELLVACEDREGFLYGVK